MSRCFATSILRFYLLTPTRTVTVAVDKQTYLDEIDSILRDKSTYSIVRRNPIKNVEVDLNSLLKNCKKNTLLIQFINQFGLVMDSSREHMGSRKFTNREFPTVWLFHLLGVLCTHFCTIAEFLHKIIYSSIPNAKNYINNSFEFIEKIENIKLQHNHVFLLLDVSLFTSVPLELALKSIKTRWKFIWKNTKISLNKFISASNLVTSSTFFIFNNRIYKQTHDMGSPLSPIIADIVMQDLEMSILKRLPFTPSFHFRYVDDIILTAPRAELLLLKMFNDFHGRLQFTIEIQNNCELTFLDTKLIVDSDAIHFDWHWKESSFGRYLNFFSTHHVSQKVGTVIGLVDRAFYLLHPRFHEKNLKLIINILLDTDYPLHFIFNVINNR